MGVTVTAGSFFDEPFWQNLMMSIGSSLIATGAAGMVLYLYVYLQENNRERLDSMEMSGIIKILKARSVVIRDEYTARIEAAKNIDIIGYGLSAFREDYKDKFAEFSKTKGLRILVPHPDFPSRNSSFCHIRDSEEFSHDGKIEADIKAFISQYKENKNIDRNNFQIRYMKTIPTLNIFRTDDELFFGPYIVGEASRNTFTFIVNRRGFLYESLTEHFDKIWKSDTFSEQIEL